MIIVNSNQLSMIKRQLDLGDKTPDYNLVKILQKRFTIGMKFFRVVKECISLNEWHKRNYENYKHKKP